MPSLFRIATTLMLLSAMFIGYPAVADAPSGRGAFSNSNQATPQGWFQRFSANDQNLGIAGGVVAGFLGACVLLFGLLDRRNTQRARDARRIRAPRAVAPRHAKKDEKAATPQTMGWTPLDQTTTVVDELGSAEEEAEVFMLLGRVDMAIGVLRHYIETHDDPQPHVWMSLLDLLYCEGRRDEFEALASEIKGRFNLALPTWEAANSRNSGSIALEYFPHVLEKIHKQWNSADCLGYLRGLIHDTRDGTRNGFHQEVFRELVLLMRIQEFRAKTAA